MRAFIIILILVSNLFFESSAQVDEVYTGAPVATEKRKEKEIANEKWKDQLVWGGNMQAWIGNSTFIFLSPNIGYMPFKNLTLGLGAIYNYSSFRGYYGTFSQSIFGGHSFIRYNFAGDFFVQGQFDRLYQPDYYSVYPDAKRWVDYKLVGLGARRQIGERAALLTTVMYNIKADRLSIYPFPLIVQFGFVGSF